MPPLLSMRTHTLLRHWAILLATLVVVRLTATAAEKAGTSAPHWAFRPIANPSLPAVTNAAWCRTSIDRFLLSHLEAQGTEPGPAAGRRTLIRRASFDLTGLPPSPEAIDSFIADDSPDATARLIDQLLDSPRYGEHWGRHWLDVVRYADTAGETADYPVPVAWRYRNYVIDAFNQDKPYDQFLREQIAGDILARTGPPERYAEQVVATGYLAISRRFGFDSENYHHLTIQDTIDNVGQNFLGLTLGCARCHNHKYDPVSIADYYSLYGIFESTRYPFPGSEQKQRTRSMAPLVPPQESQTRWRAFEQRVATLAAQVERNRLSVPSAVLRSVNDMDGDFELQAPAAGGSKGVLVPPWVYEGPIAITTDAQSPFRNVHPSGRVGASIPAGTNAYFITQALPSAHTTPAPKPLHLNLDFRTTSGSSAATGRHRLRLGTTAPNSPVEILLAEEAVEVRVDGKVIPVRRFKPGQWQNLQLSLHPSTRTFTLTAGTPGDTASVGPLLVEAGWDGLLDRVRLDPAEPSGAPLPALAIDNLALQDLPFAPVSTAPPAPPAGSAPDLASIDAQRVALAGIDGDFELQSDNTPPENPWGPGPNSVVQIRAASQSPFRNIHPAGSLGIHLPNSGAYNGFGQTLTNVWKVEKTGRMFVSFDFRIAATDAGGDGSWRFYLGHGPGNSAAVEVAMNSSHFYRRSDDSRDIVQPLLAGEWYQVQLDLNLRDRRYSGSITAASSRKPTRFDGALAKGWDGTIDYTFIDSYGHLPGVKPALDADNFAIGESPVPAPDAPDNLATRTDPAARRKRIAELRSERSRIQAEGERTRQELATLLAEGPVAFAYAVAEGTPRDVRIQLRGEPEKPGDLVPRGMLPVLGGSSLPSGTRGSGRRELAEWLASPRNPLTARVIVNRVWQYHFGEGLVRTPNDFGLRGQRPTHPELLDHLATRFMESGWSIKSLHRLIMNSAVYQLRSRYSPNIPRPTPTSPADDCPILTDGMPAAPSSMPATTENPGTHPRRRLTAEETRDSLLLVSGALDLSPAEGHPFPAPTTWGFTQHGPYNAVYEHNRRSVFLMAQRIKRHPFLALFDGADPNTSTAGRRTTTVPTQALFFMNDPFVHACAQRFATRITSASPTESERIETAWRLAFGRKPTTDESVQAVQFLADTRAELTASGQADPAGQALSALARVIFASNEFLTVD